MRSLSVIGLKIQREETRVTGSFRTHVIYRGATVVKRLGPKLVTVFKYACVKSFKIIKFPMTRPKEYSKL